MKNKKKNRLVRYRGTEMDGRTDPNNKKSLLLKTKENEMLITFTKI